jgi:hypothetical protein
MYTPDPPTGFAVTPVPGASAVTAALSVSGFPGSTESGVHTVSPQLCLRVVTENIPVYFSHQILAPVSVPVLLTYVIMSPMTDSCYSGSLVNDSLCHCAGFVFLGFFPRKPSDRARAFSWLLCEPKAAVWFEAPTRIQVCIPCPCLCCAVL